MEEWADWDMEEWADWDKGVDWKEGWQHNDTTASLGAGDWLDAGGVAGSSAGSSLMALPNNPHRRGHREGHLPCHHHHQ